MDMQGKNKATVVVPKGQQGPRSASISRSSDPLGVREEGFQRETQQPKAYVVKSQKMPEISLTVADSGDGNRSGSAKVVSKIGICPSQSGNFRERYEEEHDPDENLRKKFI